MAQASSPLSPRDGMDYRPLTTVAGIVEKAVETWGEPDGYILGEEGSGAFVAGLYLAANSIAVVVACGVSSVQV